MASLMDELRGSLGDDTVGQIASRLGESADSTRKAIGAGIPSLLVGLLDTAGRPGGADEIAGTIKNNDWGNVLDGLGGVLGGGGAIPEPAPSPSLGGGLGGILKMGQQLLEKLFSGKSAGLMAMIAALAGMKNDSVRKLMMLLAPMLLGKLGGVMKGMGGVSAGNLTRLLSDNRDAILGAAPAGLSNVLGFASLKDVGRTTAGATPAAATRPATSDSGLPGWLLPLLAVVALGLVAYALLSGGTQDKAEVSDTDVETPVARDGEPVATPEVTTPVEPLSEEAKKEVGDLAMPLTETIVMKDIVGIASDNPQFSTLVTALKAAGLVETLQGAGPFTVFAPNDEAFAKLPEGTVADLLKPENKDKLVAILTFHVVPGKVMAAQAIELAGKAAKSVQGGDIPIVVEDGKVYVGTEKAQVIATDIESSNGVIHVIDSVIMPPSE